MLCLLDAVFGWTRDANLLNVPVHQWRKLPNIVADELMSCCMLSPFMYIDMTANIARQAFTSDATLHHGCVTICDLSVDERVWLWARAPRRAGRVRMAGDEALDSLAGVNQSPPEDPLLVKWLRAKKHRLVTSYKFRKQRNINVQECLAYRTVIRRCAADRQLHRKRVISFVDSTVARGVATRGRGSSRALNHIMCNHFAFYTCCPFVSVDFLGEISREPV
jgi:hypothetical protein